MAIPKKKFRELVFQLLYSQDFFSIKTDDYSDFMMKIIKTTEGNVKKAHLYTLKILEKVEEIDEMIEKTSSEYRLERILKVELNILRLGIFEIFYDSEIPERVAISEAIRLCRKFGSRESAKFVNAILDNLYKKSDVST
jgi:N utilization substance protein B